MAIRPWLLAAGVAVGALSASPTQAKGTLEVDPSPTSLSSEWVDSWWPVVKNMGISGLLGMAAAAAVKLVGRVFFGVLGATFILTQVLASQGYVTIHWDKIHRQYQSLMSSGSNVPSQEGLKGLLDNAMAVLSAGVPSVSGFVAGVIIGLKIF